MTKKKSYLVMSRNPNVLDTGLRTDKGNLKFKKGKNGMFIGDKALADEIDKEHGLKGTGDVWVHEDPRSEPYLRDDGAIGMGVHSYFWGGSARYTQAWEEFEKRRKDRHEKSDKQSKAAQNREDTGNEELQKGSTTRSKKRRNTVK